MAPDTDDLPEPPMAFITALLESDNVEPTTEQREQQKGVALTQRQFEGLATREAERLNEEALLDAFYEKKKAEIAARRKRDAWYWPAFEKMAREFVGDRKPRQRDITSGSVPLFVKLRKSPDALVDEGNEDSFKRFLKWNSEHGSKFTRRKVWLSDLTQKEYEDLLGTLPAEVCAKVESKIEVCKNDLKKHWKTTGEVPAGFKAQGGEDRVVIEVGIGKPDAKEIES